MRSIKSVCLIVTVILLSGCGQPSTLTSIVESSESPVYTQTPIVQPPTPEETTTPPPTSFEIHSYCPEVDLSMNSYPKLTGTLVLSGENISLVDKVYSPEQGQRSLILFWDADSGARIQYQLPEHQEYYYFVVSPDKNRLAFTEGKTLSVDSEVFVLSNHGEQWARFILPGDWTLFGWLDNERLLVRQLRLRGENTDMVALNPLNGNKRFLSSSFPNIYSKEAFISWGALTIFNATALLVVYPERNGNERQSVIWDVQNNEKIANITGGDWPRWSPTEEKLLLTVEYEQQLHKIRDEIVVISSRGSIIRHTYFNESFDNHAISLPEWSPNGRYVAFWLSDVLPITNAKLAVLDLQTSKIDLYCLEINPFPLRFGSDTSLGYSYYQVNAAPPIWSPDSHYLLVEDYQQFISKTYLFDLQEHAIMQIAENARPVSWMK